MRETAVATDSFYRYYVLSALRGQSWKIYQYLPAQVAGADLLSSTIKRKYYKRLEGSVSSLSGETLTTFNVPAVDLPRYRNWHVWVWTGDQRGVPRIVHTVLPFNILHFLTESQINFESATIAWARLTGESSGSISVVGTGDRIILAYAE